MEDLKNDFRLVARFFDFYADFNFNSVISPFNACAFEKGRYYIERHWQKSVCIEGPIMKDRNLGWNIGYRKLSQFIKLCERFDE